MHLPLRRSLTAVADHGRSPVDSAVGGGADGVSASCSRARTLGGRTLGVITPVTVAAGSRDLTQPRPNRGAMRPGSPLAANFFGCGGFPTKNFRTLNGPRTNLKWTSNGS